MSWRRILMLSTMFVIALGVTTWFVLQRSDAATGFVRRELAALFAAPTTLGGTELDLGQGRLSLRGLRIDDPTRPGTPLLEVGAAHVDVEANPLGELGALHGVRIEGAIVDIGPTLPRLDQLLQSGAMAARNPSKPASLPPITVRNGRLRFTARIGAPAFELADLSLDLLPVTGSPGRLALEGSATLTDLGAPLHLRGEIDLAGGATSVTASLRDSTVTQATLKRLEQQLGIDLHGLDAAARIHELSVHYTATPAADANAAAPQLEVTGKLASVRATAPGLPKQVRNADVTFVASNRRDGDLLVKIAQQGEGGQLDLTTEITGILGNPSYSVRASGRNVLVDADVVDALRLFPLGRDLMVALQPQSGRADIDIYLQDPHLRTGIAEFDMELRDGAMAYHGFGEGEEQVGFPIPLVLAHGRVRLRDDIVLLENLNATIAPIAGGGSVRLDGRIETRAPAGEDTTLDIRATNVNFSSHLREALMALLHDDGQLYDRLAPAGRTEVEVHVRPRQQLDGGWSLTVRPQAATMLWGGFPYRLENLTGTVVARRSGVEFDLAGAHGQGQLAMRGHIPLSATSPDGIGGFEAAVELSQLAIDEDLRKAVAVCAPQLDGPWLRSRPTGCFDGKVKVWRPSPHEPLYHDLQLDLDGVAIELPCAPWRATALRGQLLAQGSGNASRLDFDALRGQLVHGSGPPAELAMLGTLASDSAVTDSLAFVVRGLQLDAQLGASLEQLGAMWPGTWAALSPSGTVDLVCRHELDAAGAQQLRLVVQLIDVASEAPMLPKPARHMTGELQVADGVLTFEDVRADIGGALVRFHSGRVGPSPTPDPRTEIAFGVAATGFPLDDGLAHLFSGPLQRAVAERHLTGRVDVDELALKFLMPAAGSAGQFETELGGQLRLYDVAMALGAGPDGIRVDNINGVVSIDTSRVGETGGQLTGTLRRTSLRVFGQPLEAIEARFLADAERLALPTLVSRLHGGQLRASTETSPALHYTLPCPAIPEGRLAANLQFEKVDVFAFLKECGWASPPYSGSTSGQITLERLDGHDVVDALGSGDLSIDRGDLGVVPLFTAIYSQLPAPERPRFDRLATRFRLDQRRLEFEKLSLHSNLLEATGSGSLGLDGYLDVELKLDNLLGPSADPVLMPFVDFLTQNIVRFHLFGHLRDLRAEKRWVTERSPARRSVLPMPPFCERLALPDY